MTIFKLLCITLSVTGLTAFGQSATQKTAIKTTQKNTIMDKTYQRNGKKCF
jgi:hypothetical protein